MATKQPPKNVKVLAILRLQKENDMIKYESGTFHDKNWGETIGTCSEAVIPDEETALKIAKAIFDGYANQLIKRKEYNEKVYFKEWIACFTL